MVSYEFNWRDDRLSTAAQLTRRNGLIQKNGRGGGGEEITRRSRCSVGVRAKVLIRHDKGPPIVRDKKKVAEVGLRA